MQIQIEKITENEDGTCDVQVNMDDETKVFLINYAILDILKKEVERLDKEIHGDPVQSPSST